MPKETPPRMGSVTRGGAVERRQWEETAAGQIIPSIGGQVYTTPLILRFSGLFHDVDREDP